MWIRGQGLDLVPKALLVVDSFILPLYPTCCITELSAQVYIYLPIYIATQVEMLVSL